MHAGLFAKPGELPLRISPRGLLDRGNGASGSAVLPFHVVAQSAVADEKQRFGVLCNALRYKGLHFVEPATLDHLDRAPLDPLVERRARRIQADLDRPKSAQTAVAPLRCTSVIGLPASMQTSIARTSFGVSCARDACRGSRIHTRQQAMQIAGPIPLRSAQQTFAQILRAQRRIGQAFQ